MSLSDPQILAGLIGSILLGAALQRVTGVGFALVAAPFLVAVLGPFNGVLVVNLFGTVTALAVFIRVFRQVEYRRVMLLLAAAMVATLPGAWVAMNVRADVLSVVIGVLILVALGGAVLLRRCSFMGGRAGAVAGGFTSGFMNVTAGVGGPAVSAYAVASSWPQPAFAASAQLYFCVLGASSMLAKFSLPDLDVVQWLAGGAALLTGIAVGEVLARRVPAGVARRAVIVLSLVGALVVIAKGALEWGGLTGLLLS